MIVWRNVSLLGIDVGFSATAKSTGIAIYAGGGPVALSCIGSSPQHRGNGLPNGMVFDAIAIDGPVVPGVDTFRPRNCETVLSRGAFSRRCKPGASHFGFGLPLRQAATVIADEMVARANPVRETFGPCQARPGKSIVEAFPNAFLGVLLDDADYDAMGTIKRGNKSDVFYERLAARRSFDAILDHLSWTDDALRATFRALATDRSRAAHDKRAALVCLLTAACAIAGQATFVGDADGGWICLPPKALWADWAVKALDAQQPFNGTKSPDPDADVVGQL